MGGGTLEFWLDFPEINVFQRIVFAQTCLSELRTKLQFELLFS